MPERLSTTPATQAVPEIVGSGPYRYVADERVPGSLNVYRRFEAYRPREGGTPSFTAGPRIAHFDRVEWRTMPDGATAAGALRSGEIDWWEQPLVDLVPDSDAAARGARRSGGDGRADRADPPQPHAAALRQPGDQPGPPLGASIRPR